MIKKKIKTLFIIILSLVLFSCGFKPVSYENKEQIYIQKIKITGNQRQSFILKNNILLISNESAKNRYEANIKLTKKRSIKIKDKTGKITRFNVSFSGTLELIDLNNGRKFNNSFERNRDYDVASIHSDTKNNEKNANKKIIEQISDDIIKFVMISKKQK